LSTDLQKAKQEAKEIHFNESPIHTYNLENIIFQVKNELQKGGDFQSQSSHQRK